MAKFQCLALNKEVDIPDSCRNGCPHFAGNVCQDPATRAAIEKAGLLPEYFQLAHLK
jgi:hypothetical protein